jgi:hypothetical protein
MRTNEVMMVDSCPNSGKHKRKGRRDRESASQRRSDLGEAGQA